MSYRDPDMACPECGCALARLDSRDKWRCPQCAGVLVGALQLETELGEAARHLVFTKATQRDGRRPCPACRDVMESVILVGIEIDRCVAHGLVWFDRSELGRARQAVERASEHASVGAALIDFLLR